MAGVQDGLPPSKRMRKSAHCEDLRQGTVVYFGGDRRGIVQDAYGPLDEFWLIDEATGQYVRGADSEIISFTASQLSLPAPSEEWESSVKAEVRVLLLGSEAQMWDILNHFGHPDTDKRHEIQQIIALPCSSCQCSETCQPFDVHKHVTCDGARCPLLCLAVESIHEKLHEFAKKLRPDINVAVRAFHIKQALEQTGPDLPCLEGLYCLSSVSLPFSLADISRSTSSERYWRETVRCQIDLGVTASCIQREGEKSEVAARTALRESCHLELSEGIWSAHKQQQRREQLSCHVPLQFKDDLGNVFFVLILPGETMATQKGRLLLLSESKTTVADWKAAQNEFVGEPKLPEGWVRVRSRTDGHVYFYNTKTQESSNEQPLPAGWTRVTSKSTGKTYYFNTDTKKSTYTMPSAE